MLQLQHLYLLRLHTQLALGYFLLLHRYTTYSSWLKDAKRSGIASNSAFNLTTSQRPCHFKKTKPSTKSFQLFTLKKTLDNIKHPTKKPKVYPGETNKCQVWWIQWPMAHWFNPGHGGQKPKAVEVHRIASLGVRGAPRRMRKLWYFLRALRESLRSSRT